jgi:hypothetical protein
LKACVSLTAEGNNTASIKAKASIFVVGFMIVFLLNLQSVLSQIVSTFFSQTPKRIEIDQTANQK